MTSTRFCVRRESALHGRGEADRTRAPRRAPAAEEGAAGNARARRSLQA